MIKKKVFITGGAGYVGTVLVNELLNKGYLVTVYDLLIYGNTLPDKHANLKIVKGDVRNSSLLRKYIPGHDCLIHLACISNDPSFELNPKLGKEINLDAFEPLVKISRELNIKRFIYASSSSVYGIKNENDVHEDMSLEPLTDYSKFKAECEKILFKYSNEDFITTIIRPATVCGYSKRQRLDLVLNILTNLGYHKKEITIFGGSQFRPNIHIDDMVDVYIKLLEVENYKINKQIYNVGFDNFTVGQLAIKVKEIIGNDIKLIYKKTNDMRSYHISSQKIKEQINFIPKKKLELAIIDLVKAFEKKLLKDPLNNNYYYNIKRMQNINLV